MKSPKQILDAMRSPSAIRYLAVAGGTILLLGVLALGSPAPSRLTTGGGNSLDAAPGGETLPGETLAPGATGETGTAAAARKAASKSARSAVGVTAAFSETEIAVGIGYLEDAGAAEQQAGFATVGSINQRRAWDAMIGDINKTKPGGRKVVPVYYSFTTDEAAGNGDQIEQEACTLWTKDKRVFMAWEISLGSDVLHACLNKAGVPEIGGGGAYSKTFQDYPYLVDPNGVAMDRMAAFQVDRLYDAGFFSGFKQNDGVVYSPAPPADGKPKIALIRYDEPAHKESAKVLKQKLASHGLALCDGCEFELTFATDDYALILDDATEVAQAVNTCKGKGCTHMLWLGGQGGRISVFYVKAAEDQHYRARLGLNSIDLPTAVVDFYNSAGSTTANPAYEQFKDSLLVSWSPDDYRIEPPAFQSCKKLFEAAGETFGGEDDAAGNKDGQISGYCDVAWYYRAAMSKVIKSLSVPAWMDGVHSVSPVPSASTFLMQTKLGRHDGAGAIRFGQFFNDCLCFKPTTGDIPV